jgi:hypothetical protein
LIDVPEKARANIALAKRTGPMTSMKYTTRVLPALAAAAVLAGCGSSSGIKTVATAQVATTATAKTVGSAPTTTAAPSSNLTTSQRNAVKAAQDYLSTSAFSKQGLIGQLSSSAGDGYPVQDATVAVDGLNVDWTAQAVKSAKDYLQTSSFSCQGMTQQLSSSAGEKYTAAQAQYAATKVGLC